MMTKEVMKQEQDEPVGWIDSKGNMICTKINESCKPLYTTPQTKEWVGLTEEDLNPICDEWRIIYGAWTHDFAKEIEAKLKEKNT